MDIQHVHQSHVQMTCLYVTDNTASMYVQNNLLHRKFISSCPKNKR